MTRVGFTVAAPGKVMLFGEYAVLEGAPALMAAVSREVTCTFTPASTGGVDVEAVGLSPPLGEGDARRAFVDAALSVAGASTPGRYVIDSTALQHPSGDGTLLKLGLGSSAATVVALLAALRVAAGQRLDNGGLDVVFSDALRAHREASGGGSGADVAASTYGGLLKCQLDAGGALRCDRAKGSLNALTLVYSGAPADTRALVKAVRAGRATTFDEIWAARLAEISVARAQAEASLAIGDRLALVRAVATGRKAIVALGRSVEVPLLGPPDAYRRVEKLARDHRGAFKTTGAGGGDVYWLVAPDDASQEAMEADARALRLVVLSLAVAPVGVRVIR